MEISEIKKGMHIILDGELVQVVDFLHVKPGKGSAFMKAKTKNVRTGTVLEKNYNTNYKIEQAQITRKKVQYLYNDGSLFYFMDNQTYEQLEIPAERIGDDKDYLIDNLEVEAAYLGDELLGITLPEKLEMTITSIDPSTATSSNQEATLETGMIVRVPLFIQVGEKIIVTTADGKYFSRA